jgi:hypothetical protein
MEHIVMVGAVTAGRMNGRSGSKAGAQPTVILTIGLMVDF